jgi:hypothetical protein
MKSEGGAIAVGGKNTQLDAIFGVANGIRFWGWPVDHRLSPMDQLASISRVGLAGIFMERPFN